MIEGKNLSPDDKSVQSYIDAIFTFCDIKRSTEAVQLLKSGKLLCNSCDIL